MSPPPVAGRLVMPGLVTPLLLMACLTLTLALAGCGVPPSDSTAAVPPPVAAAVGGGSDGNDGGSPTLEVEAAAEAGPVRPTINIPAAWDSQVEALFGRYWLYWDAFAAAYGLPFADPDFGPLRELSTPENWASLQAQLHGFNQDGLVLVLPNRSVTEHLIRLPDTTVLDPTEGSDVILQDCWIDDFIQRTITGEVVTAGVEATLMNVTMRMLDGQWRVAGVTRAEPDADGYTQCQELAP